MHLLNIRKFGFLLVLVLSTALIISSCKDDEDPGTCDTTGLTYSNFAQDFLITNCSTFGTCHLEANKDDIAVGSYETYSDAKVIVDRGRIKGAINHLDGFPKMPKGELQLEECEINRLTAWLDAGAPE